MTLTYRANAITSGASSTTCVINVPTGSTSGDVMIAGLFHEDGGGSITPPSGWTLIEDYNHTAQDMNCATYYRHASGSEPSNYTWTAASSNFMYGGIITYSGHTGSGDPVDAHTTGEVANSGLEITISSITLANANTRVLGVGFGWNDSPTDFNDQSNAYTITERVRSSGMLFSDYDATSSGASGTVDFQPFGTDDCVGFHIGLLDSTAAGGDPEAGLIGGKLTNGGLLLKGLLVRT